MRRGGCAIRVPRAFSDRSTAPISSIAQWVHDHAQPAGLGTDTLAGADALFVPLVTPNKTIGVIALLPANPRRVFVPEQRRLLDTFAGQIAVAIERAQVAEAARDAELRAKTEGVRNALLSRHFARAAHAARDDRRRLHQPRRGRDSMTRLGAPRARARASRRKRSA